MAAVDISCKHHINIMIVPEGKSDDHQGNIMNILPIAAEKLIRVSVPPPKKKNHPKASLFERFMEKLTRGEDKDRNTQ